MDCGDQPTFNSKEEEIQYWKNFSQKLIQEKDVLQKEFDDYMTESSQLEREYEVSIDQHERTIRELQLINNRNQNEIESLRLKLEQTLKDNSNLKSEIDNLTDEKLKLQTYIRELEQKNDDLERTERMITESIAAVEVSLNTAIEKNAILESEMHEKETLKEKLQRLADETRDLKQELQIKERCPDNERIMNGHTTSPVDSNRLKVEHETQTTPLKRDPSINSGAYLSPSSRMLAYNLVGDVLKKIGNLEATLGYNRNGFREPCEIRKHTSRERASPAKQTIRK